MNRKLMVGGIGFIIILLSFFIYLLIIERFSTNVPKIMRDKLNGEYNCDGLKYIFNDKTVEAQSKLSTVLKKYPFYDINPDNYSIAFKTDINVSIITNLYFDGSFLSYKNLETKEIYKCEKIE